MAKEKTTSPVQDKPTSEQDRRERVDLVQKNIEKKFGKGSLILMGAQALENIPVISTGCLLIDKAIGVGGIPKGRISEIYGPEGSGKTTLCLQIVAQAQKAGGIVAYIDAEHSINPQYAKALGVDIDKMYLSQPSSGEEGLDIVNELVKSAAVDLVIVDSVAALVPSTELYGEITDTTVGLHARMLQKGIHLMTGAINKTNTAVVFINQLRSNIQAGPAAYGGPKDVTTGGKALKYAAALRLEVRKGETIKAGDTIVGTKTYVKVVKNKFAPPFKTAVVDMIYGQGMSALASLFDYGLEQGLITKSGSFFSFKGERLAQGREKALEILGTRADITDEIEKLFYDDLDSQTPSPSDQSDDE
ncbi:MAG: recombinase RecA [Christensenellaceae bacterium]|jgi:recombination protein RecA|nr:recombinase RecA [Christensenellaceae bacterium]